MLHIFVLSHILLGAGVSKLLTTPQRVEIIISYCLFPGSYPPCSPIGSGTLRHGKERGCHEARNPVGLTK